MAKLMTVMSLFSDLSEEGKIFLGVVVAAGVLATLSSKTEKKSE